MNVIITGAGQGIGKNIALELSKLDHIGCLYLVSQSDKVFETENEISCLSKKKVIAFKGDVSCKNFISKLREKISINQPNGLVNAAGILGKSEHFNLLSEEDLKKTYDINLIGTFNMIKLIAEINKKSERIKIVNFAGGGAAYSYPKFLPYALSKVAVVRLTETLADEFKEIGYENTEINCIAPGAVKTQMLENVILSGGIVKTTVSIDEPTNLVKFLLSADSDGITGRFIHSRDNYKDKSLFEDFENLKLRRRD